MSSKYTVVYIPGECGHPECLGLFDDKTDAVKYLEKIQNILYYMQERMI